MQFGAIMRLTRQQVCTYLCTGGDKGFLLPSGGSACERLVTSAWLNLPNGLAPPLGVTHAKFRRGWGEGVRTSGHHGEFAPASVIVKDTGEFAHQHAARP